MSGVADSFPPPSSFSIFWVQTDRLTDWSKLTALSSICWYVPPPTYQEDVNLLCWIRNHGIKADVYIAPCASECRYHPWALQGFQRNTEHLAHSSAVSWTYAQLELDHDFQINLSYIVVRPSTHNAFQGSETSWVYLCMKHTRTPPPVGHSPGKIHSVISDRKAVGLPVIKDVLSSSGLKKLTLLHVFA